MNTTFIPVAELKSHLYAEIIAVVGRADDTILQTAIDAAIAEVGSYLTRYDVPAIFAAVGAARNSIILLYTKDCAIWHYIQLANPNIDMALRLERYQMAIHRLRDIQKGIMNPVGLPPLLITVDPLDPNNSSSLNTAIWGNARKRNSGYF